ncbi:unnamed protein product, partial [Staurois parvus]
MSCHSAPGLRPWTQLITSALQCCLSVSISAHQCSLINTH